MISPLYPLRFEPLFKNMLWGGRRLPEFLDHPAPSDDPIGEAWVLSDVDGSLSRVAEGPLAGKTLRELLAVNPERILGDARAPNGRFPLLLKFIDARQELSVQVHPNDEQAAQLAPASNGKTEAWFVLDADPATSKIYAGFAPGMTAERFQAAMADATVSRTLHSFTPSPGDCVFLPAGTVHAIGANILLFEVQQTSDITYRLYDWDRVDAKTGQPRQLHIKEGLACSEFGTGPVHPVTRPETSADGGSFGRLVVCNYFDLTQFALAKPFALHPEGSCEALVCVAGRGELEYHGRRYSFSAGDVYLLPAEIGNCFVHPTGRMTVLECSIPRSWGESVPVTRTLISTRKHTA